MVPSDFAKANVKEVVDKLTTDEAILLTAGVGFWHTHAIERLGVPAIKVREVRCSAGCVLTVFRHPIMPRVIL